MGAWETNDTFEGPGSQDPSKCKSFFPRDDWLTEEQLLICPGLACEKGMPHKGKRSMVGLPWGPCNEPNLNGTHPALLAGLRCNGDVQLPYRFPITSGTHSKSCQQQCDEKMPLWSLVRDAQITQSAQAGMQENIFVVAPECFVNQCLLE